MRSKTLIPDPTIVTVERIVPDDTEIVLVARTRRPATSCPVCGQAPTRVHSWYTRSLRDLPWQGLAVRIDLHTRRWFCDNPSCPRRIFTERLPTVAAPFSQRTTRLATIVLIFGVAIGGAPGARQLELSRIMLHKYRVTHGSSAIAILLAKSETAGNTTADWSARGSFATSVRSSDDFASSINRGEAF